MYKFYRFIAAISAIIRQFYLPNPFDPLGDTFTISFYSTEIPMTPLLINLIAEPILHAFAFTITGIYYERGTDNPAKGSFLYLFFYAFHTSVLYLLSIFRFTTPAIITVIVGYTVLHIVSYKIRNSIRYRF